MGFWRWFNPPRVEVDWKREGDRWAELHPNLTAIGIHAYDAPDLEDLDRRIGEALERAREEGRNEPRA